jgi:8-oxo-dGTP pyrophosphatase MutT (NUDIX family)
MTSFERVPAGDPRLAPSDDLATALAHLASADVASDEASGHRDHVASFAAANADAAHRSNTVAHLTGSALVVDARAERTLLMLHRKLGRWFQPGGHADGDTNLPAVALREAQEETGIDDLTVVVPAIDVDVHRVEPPHEAPHLHLDTRYLVVAPPGALEHANEESLALRWVTEAELDALEPEVDDSTRRLVRRGLAVARSLLGA